MGLSKYENHNGVYYNAQMVESWDGTKLNLVHRFKGLKNNTSKRTYLNLNLSATRYSVMILNRNADGSVSP